MKTKKLLALTLALIMAFSCMSITVFAQTTTYDEDITINIPAIAVGDTPASILSGVTVGDTENLTVSDIWLFNSTFTEAESITQSGDYLMVVILKLKDGYEFSRDNDHSYSGETVINGQNGQVAFVTVCGYQPKKDAIEITNNPDGDFTTLSYYGTTLFFSIPDATLDLDTTSDNKDVYSDSAKVDQTYTATVNENITNVTKVQVSWKLQDIDVTVTRNKIWNPETLTWDEDTTKTNGATASDPTAEFNFVNLSSIDVYAKVTFEKSEDIANEPTKAFTDNAETAGTSDGVIKLGNKATGSTTDNTGKVKIALAVTDSDFDAITSNTTGTYGIYTVTISDKDFIQTKKTVKATINGQQVDRTGVQLWEDGPYWSGFNIGATIDSYENVTSYDSCNVGNLYKWGATTTTGTQLDANIDIAGTANDTAKANWGSNWQMPTEKQISDLVDTTNTTWTWCDGTTVQCNTGCTLAGYKISGKGIYANNYIFLPAAGYSANGIHECQGTGISYYSSTASNQFLSYVIYGSSVEYMEYGVYMTNACSVRAIVAEN